MAYGCHSVRLARGGPVQGIHQLRRRDFPLAGVDHHVSRILTPLLSDDAVLAAVEELCGGGDLGDDPEAVLGTLLCAPTFSPSPGATRCCRGGPDQPCWPLGVLRCGCDNG